MQLLSHKRWIVALYSVLACFGLASAAVSPVPYAESFESYSAGTSLDGIDGWSAKGALTVETLDYSADFTGPSTPLTGTHTNILNIAGAATNMFETVAPDLQWFDAVIKPTPHSGDTPPEVDPDSQFSCYVNSDAELMLYHADPVTGTNRWTALSDTGIQTGKWIRLSFVVDYQTSDATYGHKFFRALVNDAPVYSAHAFADNVVPTTGTAQSGIWFALAKNTATNMQKVIVEGGGLLDDLVVTTDPVFPDVTLTVTSDVAASVATPPAGSNSFAYGAEVSCAVESPVSLGSGTRALCEGWEGTGDIPAVGFTASTQPLTLTQASSINWLWQTQVLVSVSTTGNGSSTDPGWVDYDAGATTTLVAQADELCDFLGWQGDLTGATINGNQVTVPLDAARNIEALFSGGPWAYEVISYTAGSNVDSDWYTGELFTNAPVALGSPQRDGAWGDISPFNPPDSGEIVSIGASGSLVLAFDHAVTNDAKNPYGLDLLVFGNTFFSASDFSPTAEFLVTDGFADIEISQDGVAWYPVTPQADDLFPGAGYTDTQAVEYQGDFGPYWSYEGGTTPSDFLLPVDPALNWTNMTFEPLQQQYAGSGGGTGIDIAEAGLEWVRYVRFTQPGDAAEAAEIHAMADVAPMADVTLSIATYGAGSVTPSGGAKSYGSWTTLTAVPDDQCTFIGWSGDTNGCIVSGSAIQVRNVSDRTITASFTGGPWGYEVISYTPGSNVDSDWYTGVPFTNSQLAVGMPQRNGDWGDISPFSPPDTSEIVSIGAGGSLVLAFDHAVTNDAKNPYGLDLLVFGNTFFSASDFSPTAEFLVTDGFADIEISQDGVAWYPVTPQADTLFPSAAYTDTQAVEYQGDFGPYWSFEVGSTPSDFTLPVLPSLNWTNMTFEQVQQQYAGSGGGTGVDIAEAGLEWIRYVRLTQPGDASAAAEVHAVADVAVQTEILGVPISWFDTFGLGDTTYRGYRDAFFADTDIDGVPAWQEFYAGTSPDNGSELFKIIAIEAAGTSNRVTWLGGTTGSSLPFEVLGTQGLGAEWTVIGSEIGRSSTGTNRWWHTDVNGDIWFYRVRVAME